MKVLCESAAGCFRIQRKLIFMEKYNPPLKDQKQYWDKRWSQSRTPNDWNIMRGICILEYMGSTALFAPKILDIGCGTGWFTEKLSRIGEATGIDLSSDAIEIARLNYPRIDFMTANLYDYPFEPESFDVVVAQEVLPHVEDQPGFIHIVRYVLKDSGYLVLTMANKFAMESSSWDHGPSAHITDFLSMKEIRKLLTGGFRIIKSTTIIAIGDKGILRLVNSARINRALRALFTQKAIDRCKGFMGCGYTRVLLAQKITAANP